jgi:hypothetical protein
VIAAGTGSQLGPLAVRDANGTIYEVDQITKYSVAEDYAEFTVRNGPRVKPLETEARPELNETVYAVGDALGEGIVIRDGLYTSDTPEERSGRWKWLRFSAAASPGNSGGPLIDRRGRVIGVVLRKSPNENLNLAVSITQVQHGSTDAARLESRFTYAFPPMQATDPATSDDRFSLPKPIGAFYAAALASLDGTLERVQTKYLADHAAQLFPAGADAAQLLNDLIAAPFPRAIVQRPDNTWSVTDPKPQKAQLEHNGSVEWAFFKTFGYLRLRSPDGLARSTLYGDSTLFMDLLLKGLQLYRTVGSDRVRVTSLGRAKTEAAFPDDYGRTWQVRTWRVPFNDTVLLTLGLPTPQGYVVIAKECPSHLEAPMTRQLEALARFTYVSFEGSLAEWRDYLAQPLQPGIIRSLDLRFDYGKAFHYRSRRVSIDVPATVQTIDAASVLTLQLTYFIDPAADGATVWDVGGIYLADTDQKGNWIDILRRHEPPPGLPDSFAASWRTVKTRAHPYTGTAYATEGHTRIDAVVPKVGAKDASPAYTVAVSTEGTQDQPAMKRRLDAVLAGVTVLESADHP